MKVYRREQKICRYCRHSNRTTIGWQAFCNLKNKSLMEDRTCNEHKFADGGVAMNKKLEKYLAEDRQLISRRVGFQMSDYDKQMLLQMNEQGMLAKPLMEVEIKYLQPTKLWEVLEDIRVGEGWAGQAITQYKCAWCGGENEHHNTNTPSMCPDCATRLFNEYFSWIDMDGVDKLFGALRSIALKNEVKKYKAKCDWYHRMGWDKPKMPNFLKGVKLDEED